MSATEIKKRMAELGVDRAWLAEKCNWSLSNVVNVLAPKGSNRSPKAIARIVKELESEAKRQQAPEVAFQTQQLVLHPDLSTYKIWNCAHIKWANKHPDPHQYSLVDWATHALNDMADREFCNLKPVTQNPTISYKNAHKK